MSSTISVGNEMKNSSVNIDQAPLYYTAAAAYSREKTVVRFASFVKCKSTISRRDYTEKEARRTWTFSDEKAEILNGHRNEADRMASGKKPRKNSTYRGLETINREDVRKLNIVIDTCVNAVLDEQDEQWTQDVFKWKRFAKISRKHSRESKILAIERAKFDEREAQRAYQQMDDETDENSSHQFISAACTPVEGHQEKLFLQPKSSGLNTKCTMNHALRIQMVPVLRA
eukprot:scaffold7084_cov100-Cylindrotheca_fusiformis.AAC.4